MLAAVSGCANQTPLGAVNPAAISDSNLVVNGNFELGRDAGQYLILHPGSTDLPGWTITRESVDLVQTFFPAPEGHRMVDLDGTPGFGSLQQVVNTTPGQSYRLTFLLAGNPDRAPTTKRLGVRVGDKVTEFTHDASMNWTHQVLDFTATQPSTVLEFTSLDTEGGYCGPMLDDVRLVPVPRG
jgi:choice-of-anchor C domain-containing protein